MRKLICFAFVLVSLCACANLTAPVTAGQDTDVPDQPTNLRLTIVGNGFSLTWDPPSRDRSGITGYEIVRAELASGPFIRVARVDKSATRYIDTTARPEIIYYYKVRTLAGGLASSYSNAVTGER